MTKRASFLKWFLPAAVFYIAGFVFAAMFDLAINQALYNPHSLFAGLMEAFGWLPAFLPVALLAMLWATQPGSPPVWRRVLCGVLAAAAFAAMYYASWHYLQNRALAGGWLAVLWLALALLLPAAMLVCVLHLGPALREKLTFFALFGSAYMVANQALVYTLKTIWARTRFDDMLAQDTLQLFRPWYAPFGNGGSSFPSGHTANAAGVFVLLILCDLLPAWNRRRRLVTVGCWVYIATMAFSRILIGRHFLSDTLAASAIMALAFYAMHHSKIYQKGLRQVLANTC